MRRSFTHAARVDELTRPQDFHSDANYGQPIAVPGRGRINLPDPVQGPSVAGDIRDSSANASLTSMRLLASATRCCQAIGGPRALAAMEAGGRIPAPLGECDGTDGLSSRRRYRRRRPSICRGERVTRKNAEAMIDAHGAAGHCAGTARENDDASGRPANPDTEQVTLSWALPRDRACVVLQILAVPTAAASARTAHQHVEPAIRSVRVDRGRQHDRF